MPDKLASAREVADYYGVPLNTLYQWRSRGQGPTGIRVGRHVRFRWRDVEAWLDAHADSARAAR